MAIDWKRDSQSFDTVAELYEAYRPGYPESLVEQILTTTGIPKRGRILEIGSGTGKATALFAQRGYSILCIEPGKHLARIARQKLVAFRKVKFQITTFEDWEEVLSHILEPLPAIGNFPASKVKSGVPTIRAGISGRQTHSP